MCVYFLFFVYFWTTILLEISLRFSIVALFLNSFWIRSVRCSFLDGWAKPDIFTEYFPVMDGTYPGTLRPIVGVLNFLGYFRDFIWFRAGEFVSGRIRILTETVNIAAFHQRFDRNSLGSQRIYAIQRYEFDSRTRVSKIGFFCFRILCYSKCFSFVFRFAWP